MSDENPFADATLPSPIAIHLDHVWVQYRLRHAHHYNLKRTLTNFVTRKREEPEIITALNDVSMAIPAGARVGVSGPNGAGKSTLLSVMAGLLTPTKGTSKVQGRVLALLGGPNEGLDPEQTGRENALSLGVKLGDSLSDMQERMDDIREFSGLGARFDHPVYTYSSGMQVRLRFTTITSVRADILVVDEGIGAADADFNSRAEERLNVFYGHSGTLVLASHSDDVLATHCDEAMHLERGVVSKDGFAPWLD
ncbi:MAG: ATP-binding cassette domain-containing protein [Actinomycetes bacterium]